MYSKAIRNFCLKNTVVAISLLCAATAQANVYGTPPTKLQVSAQISTHSAIEKTGLPVRDTPKTGQWLTLAQPATTLHLTRDGLASFGFAGSFAALLASEPAAALVTPAPDDRTAPSQDRITTASIRVTAAPADDVLSQSIRQDRPLFGAHRIRFGKIKSGLRISGLIRKAAASGSSAICINRCAALAERLTLDSSDITAQLRHVSASINGLVAYKTDEQNHGRLDVWSTPNETLDRSSGDCEDYAILKMAVLSHLGIPMNAMEIVVVKDTSRRLFHAVLSVALTDRTVILDNMTDAIEPDTGKRNYAPLFSLSGTANYVFGYKGGKQNLTASLANIGAIAPGAGF